MNAEFIELVGVAIGGGILTEVFRAWRNRKADSIDSATKFYALWNQNMNRMDAEVEKLQILVAALKAEIIALGGDPLRIEIEIARKLTEARDETR